MGILTLKSLTGLTKIINWNPNWTHLNTKRWGRIFQGGFVRSGNIGRGKCQYTWKSTWNSYWNYSGGGSILNFFGVRSGRQLYNWWTIIMLYSLPAVSIILPLLKSIWYDRFSDITVRGLKIPDVWHLIKTLQFQWLWAEFRQTASWIYIHAVVI